MSSISKEHIWRMLKLMLLAGLIFIQVRYPEQSDFLGIPARYVSAVLFFLTAHLIIDLLRIGINTVYLRRKRLYGKGKDNFFVGVNQIAGLASFVFFVFSLLVALELDVKQVFTSLSIVAAAIAILSKDYFSNMINGMIIMFGDQFSIGDQVRIGQQKGRISDITLLNIHLVNDDDDLIYIPNNMVLAVEVINLTKRPVKKVSVDFDIALEKLENVSIFEVKLKEALLPVAGELVPDSSHLKVVEVRKDSVAMKFQCVLTRSSRELEKNIRRTILRRVVEWVGESGVISRLANGVD